MVNDRLAIVSGAAITLLFRPGPWSPHAVVGGALSAAQGGSFVAGFASAGIGSVAEFGSAGIGDDAGGVYTRAAIAITAGGLASEITGGKFANGAVTGAFGICLL